MLDSTKQRHKETRGTGSNRMLYMHQHNAHCPFSLKSPNLYNQLLTISYLHCQRTSSLLHLSPTAPPTPRLETSNSGRQQSSLEKKTAAHACIPSAITPSHDPSLLSSFPARPDIKLDAQHWLASDRKAHPQRLHQLAKG